MPIYVLKHPSPDFRGFAHGVDFHNGVGSTSCREDKDFLVEHGYEVVSPTEEANGTGAGLPAPASTPQEAVPEPEKPRGRPGRI